MEGWWRIAMKRWWRITMKMEGQQSCWQEEESTDDSESLDGSMEVVPVGYKDVSMELEVLDCPVCHHPLRPPIFQCCDEGHCVCTSCRDQIELNKCHSCPGKASLRRFLAMEEVVKSVLVPCIHADRGCTEKMSYHEVEEHETACSHAPRPRPCPNRGCGIVNTMEMERKRRGECEAEAKAEQEAVGDSSGKRRRNVSLRREAISCAECHEPFTGTIYQCGEGLCFCWHCELTEKHECSAEGPMTRCFAMEQVLKSTLVLRCDNADYGCTDGMLSFEDMGHHEIECFPKPCYYPDRAGCGFAGTPAALMDHFAECHGNWPSTEFRYNETFDIRVQPGLQVLRAQDGRLFIAHMVLPGEALGYAVALVCVQNERQPRLECSVCFAYSEPAEHRSVTSMDYVGSSSLSDWPPKNYSCVVPWKSYEGTAAVLRTTIQEREAQNRYAKLHPIGMYFDLKHCYEKIQNQHKWRSHVGMQTTSSKKRSSSSGYTGTPGASNNPSTHLSSNEDSPHAMGTKKAKAKMHHSDSFTSPDSFIRDLRQTFEPQDQMISSFMH